MANATQNFSASDVAEALQAGRYIYVRLAKPVDLDGHRWIFLSFSRDLDAQIRAWNGPCNAVLGFHLLPVMAFLDGSNEPVIPYVFLDASQGKMPFDRCDPATMISVIRDYADCISALALPSQSGSEDVLHERLRTVAERAARIGLTVRLAQKTLEAIAKTDQSSAPLWPSASGPMPLVAPPLEVLRGGKPTYSIEIREYGGTVSAVDTSLDIVIIGGTFAIEGARKIWSRLPEIGTTITLLGKPAGELRLGMIRVTEDPQQRTLTLAPAEDCR